MGTFFRLSLKQALFFTLYHTIPVLKTLKKNASEINLLQVNEKILVTSIFLLFP